jgi:hypothetical protein
VATQGILLGIGLSVLAMVVASVGLLPPLVGAFLQEGIDLLVIANALRATTEGDDVGESRIARVDGLMDQDPNRRTSAAARTPSRAGPRRPRRATINVQAMVWLAVTTRTEWR